ncbi:hypothetical protein C8E03_10465 [Lachnotalea glycerini]|uniref:Zf-HC2 domain-containing protein n=1 Tax=Lachnotalea glycerini TaxID=1763509 RepID=A0A255I295_9FIRM|nr:zf-HC2 domain-containing protein [Lachnotalea glycerini]PXV91058.1 hypothetical protein C8E03_10465 [Lachnotalea glycerini]RDY30067.1 zf-HC2 domain-containing protein [Lachnotalea glycerini]
MNHKVTCCIVQDLLPNYIDKLTCDETNSILEEHFGDCARCNAKYEKMVSEMEISTVQEELAKEKSMKDILSKAKLGYAMKRILQVLRILTVVLYSVMNIVLIYIIASNTKYYTITEKTTAQNTLLLFSITLLIPSVLIATLFIKKDTHILIIVKGLLQVILLIILPFAFIIGTILSLRMPSYTTNASYYGQRDEYANELLISKEFTILPKSIPENSKDVDYVYKYETIFDDTYLTLSISWTYDNDTEYQKAKSDMQSYEPVNDQVAEEGYHMTYAVGNSKDNNEYFRFGYDDEIKRVTYQIYDQK